jgi:outer membrane beta-barrel protein
MKKTILLLLILSFVSTNVLAKSPNERIHALQKRDYSVKNKLEIGLFGGMSINDTFTQHYSTTLALDYHLNEAFALELAWMSCKVPFMNGDQTMYEGQYTGDGIRFGNRYTDAYSEVNDAQLLPSNADLAMISNYVGLNVQFSPIYGKWSLFGMALGHADFYLSAGGGVAGTEYKNTFGYWQDTGTYFVGTFGLGFRVFLARWFAIRLDVRDYTFAARVQATSGTSTSEETKIRNTLFVSLGISFLFLGEEPVKIWSPY